MQAFEGDLLVGGDGFSTSTSTWRTSSRKLAPPNGCSPAIFT